LHLVGHHLRIIEILLIGPELDDRNSTYWQSLECLQIITKSNYERTRFLAFSNQFSSTYRDMY